MPRARPRGHGVMTRSDPIPLARARRRPENSPVKKRSVKKTKPRGHESREDRARTLAGKTANSKVRSAGRTLAAVERGAKKKRTYEAGRAKKRR